MKIRIKGNSIRFRLTRSEVEKLDVGSDICEQVDFGHRPLFYSVQCTDVLTLSADFTGDRIILYFPVSFLEEWKSTEKVGFKGQSGAVAVLIEKDFTCLDNVEEDQSDNYPNPLLNPER